MVNVKVFADKQTDNQTGQKLYAADLSMQGHNNKKGTFYSKDTTSKHITESRLPLPSVHCTSQWTLIFQQYLSLSNCKQSPSLQPACQSKDIQIHHSQPLCRQSVHCLYHCKYSEKNKKKKALGKHCRKR